MAKGTIAVEEAVINPNSVEYFGRMIKYLEPGSNHDAALEMHKNRLSDIYGERLKAMDEEGVEYMLLSITSPGCQDAENLAFESNNWLAEEGVHILIVVKRLRSDLA